MKKTYHFKDTSKLLFAFIVLLVVIISCSSCSKETDMIPEDSKIEFSLYGNTKTYVQVNAGSQVTGLTRTYSFVGTKNPSADNYFNLVFQTDSLRPGSYTIGNVGCVLFREGNHIVTSQTSNFTINITSNVNGLVNGSFSGTLYDHETASSCSVVQGKIENVVLSYK